MFLRHLARLSSRYGNLPPGWPYKTGRAVSFLVLIRLPQQSFSLHGTHQAGGETQSKAANRGG